MRSVEGISGLQAGEEVKEPASAWWSGGGGGLMRMTLPDNQRPTRLHRLSASFRAVEQQGHSHEKRPRGERCRRR